MKANQHGGDLCITTSPHVRLNPKQKSRETNADEKKCYAHSYNKSS